MAVSPFDLEIRRTVTDSDLDGVHTDLEENYKGKVSPRLGFEDFAGYGEITSVNELNTIIDNL